MSTAHPYKKPVLPYRIAFFVQLRLAVGKSVEYIARELNLTPESVEHVRNSGAIHHGTERQTLTT